MKRVVWLSAFVSACGAEPRIADTAIVDTTPPATPTTSVLPAPDRDVPSEVRRSVGTSEPRAAKTDDGIPECEAYFARMETCLLNLPGTDRKMVEQTVAQMRETFRSMASSSGSSALRDACVMILESLSTSGTCP